jgi:molybdenum cofactor guanylyltransferase
MGQDKGKMLLNNKPLLVHLLEILEKHLDEIILVLRDEKQVEDYQNIIRKYFLSKTLKNGKKRNKNIFAFDLKIVTDKIKDQGPLAGIYTGLSHINSDYGLVLPCDSPYISDSFLDNIFRILENSEIDYDAMVPQWDEMHIEPLHSIYHKRTGQLIEKLILDEIRDVKSLIKELNVFFVDVKCLDSSLKSFKNLNRPQDLD